MNGLFTLLIIGFVIHLLFYRNGGMGCYGGHHDHNAGDAPHRDPATRVNPSDEWKSNVIDLKKEDYQVISVGEHYSDLKSH